jgi:hypothetical protein
MTSLLRRDTQRGVAVVFALFLWVAAAAAQPAGQGDQAEGKAVQPAAGTKQPPEKGDQAGGMGGMMGGQNQMGMGGMQ